MADSTQQRLWAEEVEQLLASTTQPEGSLEHLLWGCQQRMELLRNLAAHALTGGQPLVASALYQQIGELEEQARLIRKSMESPV
jgi:hypothetical protein